MIGSPQAATTDQRYPIGKEMLSLDWDIGTDSNVNALVKPPQATAFFDCASKSLGTENKPSKPTDVDKKVLREGLIERI